MITIGIIFILSILAAFGLAFRKVWQFRKGKIIPGSYEVADWTDLSIEAIRMRLLEILKFAVHHFVLFALRTWIVLSSGVRRADKNIKERLMHLLHKNAHYPPGGKPSGFLKKIRHHKDEVVSAMQKEGSEEVAKKE